MLVKSILSASITILAATAIMTAPASAYDKVQFSYNSSELSSYQGAEQVYERMEQEAKAACSDDTTRPIRVKILRERCEAELISSWVSKIDDERLNKVYATAQNKKEYASAE